MSSTSKVTSSASVTAASITDTLPAAPINVSAHAATATAVDADEPSGPNAEESSFEPLEDMWSEKVPANWKLQEIYQIKYSLMADGPNNEFTQVFANNILSRDPPYTWVQVPNHYVLWLDILFSWLSMWEWLIRNLSRGPALIAVKKYLAYLDRTLDAFFAEVQANAEDMTPDWSSRILDYFLCKEYHIGRHSTQRVQEWLRENDPNLLLQHYDSLSEFFLSL